MRVVFMGTPEFAVPALRALAESGYDVAGVFTQPDRPKGRGNKVSKSPVKTVAEEYGIPVFQPARIRKDGVGDLKKLDPDLCVTAAFGQILSREILDIPRMGNINVHASLLPRHRGSSPVAHAIMDCDRTTGITTMLMDEGIDTGDILMQRELEIYAAETCGELTGRLSVLGASLLMETVSKYISGELKPRKQDESVMTYDSMLTRELSRPDFTLNADRITGLINGLNPWPCVRINADGTEIRLLRAEAVDQTDIPGTVISADARNGLVIACGSGAVRILEVQSPGGKPLKAKDWLIGHHLDAGNIVCEADRQ